MSSFSGQFNEHIQRLDAKILASFTQLNDCADLVVQRLELMDGIPPGQLWRSCVFLASLALWRQDRILFTNLYSSVRGARFFNNNDLRRILGLAASFFETAPDSVSRLEKLNSIGILAQKFRSDWPQMNILMPMVFFLAAQSLSTPEKLYDTLRYQLLSIYTLSGQAASAIPGWGCLLVHRFCEGQYLSFSRADQVVSRAERVMETPLSRLVEAVCRHVMNPTLPAPDAEKTTADFRKAYDSGYKALAGVIAGLALRDPGTADAAKTFLDERPELWVPVRPPLIRGPWESTYLEVSRILAEAVQKKAAGPAKRKRAASAYAYSWKLGVVLDDETSLSENLYKLTRLSLFRSRLLKNGSVSAASAVHAKQLLDAARKEELVSGGFPEQLAPVVLDIAHEMYSTEEFSVHARNKLFPSLLERLQGYPDVTLVPDLNEYRFLPPTASMPPKELVNIHVDITFEDLPLQTEYTPEGDLRLSIPLALKTHSLGGREECFCLAEPGTVRVLRISETMAGLYAVLRKHATQEQLRREPSLTLPAYAAKEASDLLTAAAGAIRMRGAISAAGDEATFSHIPAAVAPAVRLELDKDDILHVSLRNRIHPDAEVWCVPGRGTKSVSLPSLVPPVLADRDFAAETAAADPLRKAMEPFTEFRSGEDTWTIDDLENALNALETLHAQDASVPVEWIPQSIRRIDLSNVASARLDDAGGAEFWLGVKGDIRLDNGEVMRLSALLAALRTGRKGSFVRMGENAYLRLSKELSRRLEALNAAGEMKGETLRVNPAALPMLDKAFRDDEGGKGISLPGELAKRLARVREAFAANPRVPESIRATLRPYQDEGFRWMWRLAAAGIGCCLADDMGLGKTLQSITLLQARAAGGPSLVIAPASVCDNWIAELRRFAPRLRPVLARADDAYIEKPGAGMVVVASYGLLQRRLATFSAVRWNGLVLDEAQSIKNAASKRARGVKSLKAAFRVAATGTPVENNLDELWSLFDFLNPGLLLSHDAFVRTFTEEGRPLPALKKLIKPLILRRLKRDVLDDLPEKTEITLRVDLPKEERTGYEACRVAALQELEQSEESDRIGILAQLMRLRRYCCLPELVLPAVTSAAKMEALDELLSELHDNQHRTLVFSQFVDVLQHIKGRMEAKGWTYQYLDGKTPAPARAKSVDAFQRGEGDFFLISLKAGGLGLNLTAANYVVLVDPWWNPAVENQAADRAHRIGQQHPVTVYRLVTHDTIEERVLELHARKKELAESLLEGTGDPRLTRDDLLALFRQ